MMENKFMQTFCRAFFIFLVMVTFSFAATLSFANNLLIEDFEVYEIDTASNTISFTCNVSWENSWKSTTNQDAVWMFLKYSEDAGVNWSHASMAANGTTPMGFSAPSGFEMVVPKDEKGFFLQRTDLSSGDVAANAIRFVWDYSQDGLSDEQAIAANTINKAFGIEMVYIPQGAFYAGDGVSTSDFTFQQGSADTDPWYIQSEDAISTSNAISDSYYYQSTSASGEDATGSVFLIPTSFPKGYQSFYVMKYELTEGQWVSFFNTCNSAAKSNRDITSAVAGGKNSDAVVTRNTVAWDASNALSDATTTRVDRPVTYISYVDLMAYADWAGLRPITELEYEKAARGEDVSALANEYAWGRATYNDAQASEIYPDTDEDGTEQIFDGSANINRNNLVWSSGDGRVGGTAAGQAGPLRAGIFAENSTNRTTSGATFYGAMEFSGNLSEVVVSVGKNAGRQFLGTHGDGELSSVSGYEGNATNIDWPGINSVDSARGVTGTSGTGFRGGDFNAAASKYYQISNRTLAVRDPDSQGYSQRYDAAFGVFQGGRLGRTAP